MVLLRPRHLSSPSFHFILAPKIHDEAALDDQCRRYCMPETSLIFEVKYEY
jgi:hypothetical protein